MGTLPAATFLRMKGIWTGLPDRSQPLRMIAYSAGRPLPTEILRQSCIKAFVDETGKVVACYVKYLALGLTKTSPVVGHKRPLSVMRCFIKGD